MTYYEIIREIRQNYGYTQTQIAQILSVGQRTYSDYESGKIRIPVECVIKLAKFYNVDMNYITGVSQIRKPYCKK